MSYAKAMKHRPHRLNVGHTFNPSGLSWKSPKEGRVKAEPPGRLRRAIFCNVMQFRREGATNEDCRKYISRIIGLRFWKNLYS